MNNRISNKTSNYMSNYIISRNKNNINSSSNHNRVRIGYIFQLEIVSKTVVRFWLIHYYHIF